MGAWIRAISYYLPEETLTNETLAEAFPEWDVDKVYNKVGVRTRHLAGRTETAGDLAEKAARKLFEEYGIAPGEVDFLLLCTQSPDHPALHPESGPLPAVDGLHPAGPAGHPHLGGRPRL